VKGRHLWNLRRWRWWVTSSVGTKSHSPDATPSGGSSWCCWSYLPPMIPPAIVLMTSRSHSFILSCEAFPSQSMLGSTVILRSWRGVVPPSRRLFPLWGPLRNSTPSYKLTKMSDLDKFLNLILQCLTLLSSVSIFLELGWYSRGWQPS